MDVGLVCDACSALTPIGVPQCARCGSPVALDPRTTARASARRKAASAPPPDGAVAETCSSCGTDIHGNQKFCPSCGAKVPPASAFDVSTKVGPRAQSQTGGPGAPAKPGRSTMFFGGAVQAARAKLTLIRGDGEDGISFTLAGTDHLAGRGDCPISFPDDPFLSPTHANFMYVANGASGNQLVVRDMGSLNGIYVRLTGAATLQPGASVLIGEQVLSVHLARVAEDAPDPDGTYYSSSMQRPAALEIKQHLRGGTSGWVFRVGDAVTIGREAQDINFPDDPFISGRHAEVRLDPAAGTILVTDVGSRNGTFVRVSGEQVLRHGDYVFLGQQLLRVEIV